MALAETAELAVLLKLKDEMSASLAKAEGELKQFGTQAGAATAATTKSGAAMKATAGHAITLGGALNHAKGALGGLISGPLGMVGLGAGLFGISAFLDGAVKDTYAFGAAAIQLQRIIGGTVQDASALLAVGEKYGVSFDKITASAAFYEKTVGRLEGTIVSSSKAEKSAALQALESEKLRRQAAGESVTAINKQIAAQKAKDKLLLDSAGTLNKLQVFEAQYGLTLTDNKGKAVGYNVALDRVAKAYATTKDKAQFAAAAAQLFGRGFSALLPVIAAVGTTGLPKAEEEAKALGVTLDATTAKSLLKARDAGIAFNEAMQGLKLAIGTQLVPVLTDLQIAVTDFLTHGGITKIKDAVGGIISLARQVAGVAKTMFDAFNALPGPLKDFLTLAVIGNKALKFTFGFSGLDLLKQLGGGGIFGRGSQGNPMHVWQDNPAAGGAGGLTGGKGVIGKLLGAVSIIGAVAIAAGSIQALAQAFGDFQNTVNKSQGNLTDQVLKAQNQNRQQTLANLTNTAQGLLGMNPFDQATASFFGGGQITKDFVEGAARLADQQGQTLDQLQQDRSAIAKALQAANQLSLTSAKGPLQDTLDRLDRRIATWTGPGGSPSPAQNAALAPLREMVAELKKIAQTGKVNADQADKVTESILWHSRGGSVKTLQGAIDRLRTEQKTAIANGDQKSADRIGRDVKELQRRLELVETARAQAAINAANAKANAIIATLLGGFGGVITAVNGISFPASVGGVQQLHNKPSGSRTGSTDISPAAADAAKKRHTPVIVQVKSVVTNRSNASAATTQRRYGPSAVSAGAAVVLAD